MAGEEEQKTDLDQQMNEPKEEEANNGEEHKEIKKATVTGKGVESKIVVDGGGEDELNLKNC